MKTKFRVRDLKTKEIIGYERIGANGHWENKRVHRKEWLRGCITCEDAVVREMFTGLQDKDGKGIYKGDPLRWIDEDEVRTGVIEWDKHAYGFRIQMPKGYFPSFKLLPKDIEIIGNIHEL